MIQQTQTIASRFVNSTTRHIFLTGKAGTGKTTFLKHIIQQTHKNAIIAAPTGIAAINAGGVTLHSLFQLPFGTFIPDNNAVFSDTVSTAVNTPRSLINNIQMNTTKRQMLRELELLIIDEVSMLRSDILDAIDTLLRHIRKERQIPFGGLQILFIGDLLQLPPVVKDDEARLLAPYYKSPYFFEALALKENSPVYIELEKIYRQQDQKFITILNNLRDNRLTKADLEELNSHVCENNPSNAEKGSIFLTTHNYKADDINRKALEQLPGKSFFYSSEISGEFSEYTYPVESKLELKKNAQIMFIKNDYSGQQRYFNGKIGRVSHLSDDSILVNFDDGSQEVEVEKYTWENKRYSLNNETNEIEEKLMGTYIHFPIKLAWAITVHKSQGLTFEKAVIDVARAFAPGQIYVALSRLTSLNGLKLSAPIQMTVIGQEMRVAEYAETKENQPPLNNMFMKDSSEFVKNMVLNAFNFLPLQNQLNEYVGTYTMDENKSVKQKHHAWAKKLAAELKPIKEVADKFLGQLNRIIGSDSEANRQVLYDRVVSAKNYFDPLLKSNSDKVNDHINDLRKTSGTKAYKNELIALELLFFKQRKWIFKAEGLLKSTIENTEYSKIILQNSQLYDKNEKAVTNSETSDNSIKDKPAKEKTKKEKTKKEKTKKDQKNRNGVETLEENTLHTRDISLQMFQKGMSIEEIAASRTFASYTIENHLAQCIATGKIHASAFLDIEKIERIISASKELDTLNIGPLKDKFGDEFTYSQLKTAMAQRIYDQTK